MRYLEAACLVVITAAFVFLLLTCRTFVAHRDGEAAGLSEQASQVLSQGSAVLSRADAGVAQLNAATSSQLSTLARTDTEVLKASADLHDVLGYLAVDLHGTVDHPGAIPKLSAFIDDGDSALKQTTLSLNADLGTIPPVTAGLVKIEGQATADLSDPAIAETLGHVDATSASVDASAKDIQAFVHRETAPITGTWNIIKAFLREFAGPAAEIATAAK